MAEPDDAPARKTVTLPARLWRRVRDYRFDHRLDTETEAIKRLIEAGLDAEAERAARERESDT